MGYVITPQHCKNSIHAAKSPRSATSFTFSEHRVTADHRLAELVPQRAHAWPEGKCEPGAAAFASRDFLP